MSDLIQQRDVQAFTLSVNQNHRKIDPQLSLYKTSTYWTRYSFANIVERKEACTEFMLQIVGSSYLKMTMNYFAGLTRLKEILKTLSRTFEL